jgi:hypothetical protein
MLDGIRSSPIVVGAYTDGRGGVCPMLAAHRRGGRTSFVSFARIEAHKRARFPEIIARRLRQPEGERTPSLRRANVSSPIAS